MKRIIFLSALVIVFTANLFAQGELQFNQVINNTLSGTSVGSTETTLGTITVPAGKVWKIESVSFLYLVNSMWYPAAASGNYAKFGDMLVWHALTEGQSFVNFPIWLNAGTYDVNTRITSGTYPIKVAYSAIEFNVAP